LTVSPFTPASLPFIIAWHLQSRLGNVSKSPAEVTMWLNETLASGMVVDYHWVGAEKGLGEDRRWQKVGRDYFQWVAKHDRHFTNKRSELMS
jgi:hypothetical protein